MSRSALLNTDTEDLKELLSNGKTYEVPPYQRDYSWKQEHWEDLWEDIVASDSSSDDHYMGAIVLEASDRKQFRIIDGQQRLATLSILILACIDFLQQLARDGVDSQNNEDRSRLLEASYIGSRDPVSLRVTSKLTLNAHDNDFYQLNLTQRRAPHGGIRTLSDSERFLWRCFEFFRKMIADRFGPRQSGEAVAAFVNQTITERLVFTSVRVRDQLSAYTVFETLNARGLELTETDLLKNYLLSLADRLSKSQMEPLLAQWKRITQRVGVAQFPDFLRFHLNSRQPYLRERELFATVKRQVVDMPQMFSLLETLEVDAAWFEALRDPYCEFWADYPGAREHVRILNLFYVSRFASLALAAKDVFSAADFVEVLRYCVVISVRFHVSRRSTSALEPAYNQAAVQLRQQPNATLADVRKSLKSIYIPDPEFANSFATLELSPTGVTGKRLRYVLCELEKQLAPKELNDAVLDATVEHILPESYGPPWDAVFTPEQHAQHVERIGNYCLLERKPNARIGQSSFEVKKLVYEQSQFQMTRNLATADEWNIDRLEERQRRLAKIATAIWRLDF